MITCLEHKDGHIRWSDTYLEWVCDKDESPTKDQCLILKGPAEKIKEIQNCEMISDQYPGIPGR